MNVFLVAVLLLAMLIVGEKTQASEFLPTDVETDHNDSGSFIADNIHYLDLWHFDLGGS